MSKLPFYATRFEPCPDCGVLTSGTTLTPNAVVCVNTKCSRYYGPPLYYAVQAQDGTYLRIDSKPTTANPWWS